MSTFPTLPISYVYTVFYAIYGILPMPHGHRSSIYFMYIFLFIPLHLCVVVNLLLNIAALSELEAQAFRYTRINIF
jgi:hypothetical protein